MRQPIAVTASAGLGALLLSAKFSEAWRRRVMKALIDGSNNPAGEAAGALGSRLDAIAITETSRHYSETRQAIAEKINPGPGHIMVKRWDAMLDACQICRGWNGMVVLVSEGFPNGEPGSVHTRCKCVAHYMRVSWSEYYAMVA
jgi:hypothetical protein